MPVLPRLPATDSCMRIEPPVGRVVELEGFMQKHGEHVKKLEQVRFMGLLRS